jgi:hypothetical protein
MEGSQVVHAAAASLAAQAPPAAARNMAGVFDCDVDVNTGVGWQNWSGDAATA